MAVFCRVSCKCVRQLPVRSTSRYTCNSKSRACWNSTGSKLLGLLCIRRHPRRLYHQASICNQDCKRIGTWWACQCKSERIGAPQPDTKSLFVENCIVTFFRCKEPTCKHSLTPQWRGSSLSSGQSEVLSQTIDSSMHLELLAHLN